MPRVARDLAEALGSGPRFLRRGQAFVGGYSAGLHFISVDDDDYQETHTEGTWFDIIEAFMTSELWPHYEDDWLEGFKKGYVDAQRCRWDMQLHFGDTDEDH